MTIRLSAQNVDHFHEKYFALYVETVDSRRFSRQLRTDLPQRSCRYDVANSRCRCWKFLHCKASLTTSHSNDILPTEHRAWVPVYIAYHAYAGERGGTAGFRIALRANLGSNFNKWHIGPKSKTVRDNPIDATLAKSGTGYRDYPNPLSPLHDDV